MDLLSCESSLIQKIQDTLNCLEEEWCQLSLQENKKLKRRETVHKAISNICDKILDDEKNLRERILHRIEYNKLEVFQLCQELDIDYEVGDDYATLELDLHLQQKITELQLEKKCRFEELQQLIQEDKDLCLYLDESPQAISGEALPTSDDLYALKKHIQKMQEEKDKRKEEFENLRSSILGFLKQLEKKLDDNFLIDIVCNDRLDKFTKASMADVKKFHSELEFEAQELESLSLELRENICCLWDLLQITPDEREAFLSTVPLHSPSCIAKLESYCAELKELRRQNLGKFIDDFRTHLEKLWAKCHVGEREKEAFAPRMSTEITEEIFELFEVEVKKWRRYSEDHASILNKVDHLLSVFDAMQQLDEKSKDPQRLFNTRGGALLQEEKERKRVAAELPKIQDRLIVMCSEYESQNGHPFLIDGVPVGDYLERIWGYHDQQKEQLKNNKKVLSSTKPSSDRRAVLKSAKKTPNPSSDRKRGREVDDIAAKSCAKKLALNPSCGTAMGAPTPVAFTFRSPMKTLKVPVPIMKGSSSVPRAKKPLSEKNWKEAPPRQCVPSIDLQNSVFSYDNFKEDLQARSEAMNSTSLSLANAKTCDDERVLPF